uniref:SAM domain-containing protein n=1 Tax=Caenorhabditis tropicalis TaxID=1561998 RepID=A0A1I7UKV9_9PELO
MHGNRIPRVVRRRSRRDVTVAQLAEAVREVQMEKAAPLPDEELAMEIDDPLVDHRPPKIDKVVCDVIVPQGAGLYYQLWTTAEVTQWISLFYKNPSATRVIQDLHISGVSLHYCFLDPETSGEWCHHNGITPWGALRIRMVLGRVHNLFYGYG